MRRITTTKVNIIRRFGHQVPSAINAVVFDSSNGSQGYNARRFSALCMLAGFGAAAVVNDQCNNSISYCDNRPLSANFVADAIEMVSPAVVNIMSYVDGFLVSGISSGSGFFITEDGFIVTNAHVVSASTNGKVLVTTMNGRKRTGTVHSMDLQSDIALIKLDNEYSGEKYPIVTMGNSSKIRPGEFVVALGSPMQLSNSSSFGIVSATARHASELGFINNRAEYIQTDAAINQGNSGGPLINISGQVIGINVMKAKGADGISFAIPVDTASHVIKQLMANKHVVRPYVGLKMTNYLVGNDANTHNSQSTPRSWWSSGSSTAEQQQKKKSSNKSDIFHRSQQVKVLVERVVPGSPAEKAGIKRFSIFYHIFISTVY